MDLFVKSLTISSELKFIVVHFYYDFLCIFLPIYGSCELAPRFKALIAACFMIFIVCYSGLYTRTLGMSQLFGTYAVWKSHFTQTTVICAVVIPFLVFFIKYLKNRRSE
ncbi:hypothetical protein [Paenibacillus sp. RC67]|uniref:hypothetical protein n=1 Tax=Paenibacillus sp. RC67 TaxID=3039392 RepID=UPI0024ACF5A0|nr:hypothetical protein [Paenibacillus sp. RC67]